MTSFNTPSWPHFRTCNYCEAMCGIRVDFDPLSDADEKKINITPDRKDPFSRGAMCPKAAALGPLHYDPDKLRRPVKRVADEWLEISWEEAYATVAEKICAIRDTYGPDSIATYLGNPIVHNTGMLLFVKKLVTAIGSKNVYSATSMDQLPHHFAAHFMFGHDMRIPLPDINRTDYMIIMGANPLASNGSIMTSAGVNRRLKRVQQRSGKVVVIDPRKTETAKAATEHHFIRPGTDVFFLLALLHIFFRDNKQAPGRLADHLRDFDKLEPAVRPYTPAQAARVTSIDADTIERLAEEFSARKKAVLYGRMGLSTQPHGGLCQWLINTINIVTGNFDTPGGMMFSSPAIEIVRDKKQRSTWGRWKSRVRDLKEFGGELPVSGMADEFLTEGAGQIKAFMTICGNPVLSTPNGKRLEQVLPKLDFMFSIDNFINETTRHAHLILPTPSGLEIDHYDLIFNALAVHNTVKFSPALLPPEPDRPHDWQILKELTHRISEKGLGFLHRFTTPRRVLNWGLMLGPYGLIGKFNRNGRSGGPGILTKPNEWFSGLTLKRVMDSPHGVDLGPLRPRIPECLLTPDKKIHIAETVYLERLKEVGASEWPDLLKDAEERGKNDFLLIGRRNVSTNNSWMHQVRQLSAGKQVRCTAMIHPIDAERLQIVDGEDIKVCSRVGEIILPAEITNAMMTGVISIPHGFGHTRKGTRIPHAEAKPGASINDITDHLQLDKLTGNAAFSGQLVNIQKISDRLVENSLSGKPVTVVFGSQSGNAEMVASDIPKVAARHNVIARVIDMDDIDAATLSDSERVLVVVSTFGDGEMPDNGATLWQEMEQDDAPDFSKCFYSVLALGDSSYESFCETGRRWDRRLAELGATRVQQLVECDVDYVEAADLWVESILPQIGAKGDQSVITIEAPRSDLQEKVRYNSRNPFVSKLLNKRLLTTKDSSKETLHYELSLSGFQGSYDVGGALYILPQNKPELVDELLALFDIDGKVYPEGADAPLRQLLTYDLELRLPSKNLVKWIAGHTADLELQDLLEKAEDNPQLLHGYLYGKDVIDLLRRHPVAGIDADMLVDALSPVVPRAYSISSSIRKHPVEVHILVATVRYFDNERLHNGASSTYLSDQLLEGDYLKCYFVANRHFTVPENGNAPMIMVGPGTGVAPFRGFLEEREMRGDKGDNWLFFGDRNMKSDFLYREELEAMVARGVLSRLDLAFSRDQKEKVYVQHRMLESSKELFSWLQRGAYFFVCGDADRMAHDVDRVLHLIVQQQGKMTEQQAADYVLKLQEAKRYVKDVY